MRREIALIFVATIVVCAIVTGTHVFAVSIDPDLPSVLAGTEFPVEVQSSINAAKARPGDPVQFQTLEPILIGGNVVIPARSTLMGRVIEAHPATPSENSLLRFSIHMIEWRKHSYISMNGVVIGRGRAKTHVRGDIRQTMPSFLEGVRIRYEPSAAATTMMSSQENLVLRSGTLLVVRQVAPPIEKPAAQPYVGQ